MTMASLRFLCRRSHVSLNVNGGSVLGLGLRTGSKTFEINGQRELSSLSSVGKQSRLPFSFQYRNDLLSIEKRAFATGRRSWDAEKPQQDDKVPKKPATEQVKAGIQRVKALAKLTPHENIYTVPNFLTFTRLIAAPIVGYLVLHDYHAWAVGLFAYAGITDLVDGYIARRWNLQTVVGTVIDPMADKLLMTILTVCLAMKAALPLWLAVIILGRDVGLAISAIYYRYISLPPPKTFARYWDFSLPSAEVRPTTISKYNTALQLALIGATTALPILPTGLGVQDVMPAFQYLVAATTVWSGASYIYSKDAVKILNQEDKTKDQQKEEKKASSKEQK